MGDTRDRPPCSIGDCDRPAERVIDGVPICQGHRKRLLRGQRVGGPLALRLRDLAPLERVILAGSLFLEADAEDDHAFDLALERFKRACAAWMRAEGWTPPVALKAGAGCRQAAVSEREDT